MIPLRVLHAIAPERGPSTDGARALVSWLVNHHHAAGLLHAPGAAELQVAVSGADRLLYRGGPLASLFGQRTECLRRIAAWIPDLIHVHDLRWLPAALDLARRLRLSVLVSVTGPEAVNATRSLRDLRIGWVVLPTEGHRAHYLAKVGLSRDRVTYLPPGVDVAAAGSVPYRMVDGTLTVGFTGPCNDQSGIAHLGQALVQVSRIHAVRGRYRPSSPADALAVRDVLSPEALALIDVTDPDGGGFMGSIDVFCDPGSDDHVAFPVIEAMACARPVLAFAVGSMPELVRHGQTALLVAPSDDGALVAGLLQLVDPALRRTLGEAGRSLAAERYDLAVVGEALVELYRMAIGGTRNSSVKAEGSTVYRRISDTRLVR